MRLVVFAIAVLIAISNCAAAEKDADGPQLKDLAWLLGEWQGEYVMPGGFPEIGPAGATVVSTQTWRRSLGRSFISLRLRDEIDGKVVATGEEILGVDQRTGELGHWFFGSTGSHGSGKWSIQDKTFPLEWKGFATDDKDYEGVSHHIQVDADTYTWQMRDITENGKKIPDWPKVTFRRVVPGPKETEFWDRFTKCANGDWIGKGTLGQDNEKLGLAKGDAFSYRLANTPAMNGKAIVCGGTLQVATKNYAEQVRGVVGWDPAKHQVRWLAFWQNGLVEELLLDRCEGKKFFGVYITKRSSQKPERSGIVLDYSQPDTCAVTFTTGRRKGEVLSAFERQ